MDDECLEFKTVFNSWTGISINVFFPLASAMVSALVMSLIVRSGKKISESVFHRFFWYYLSIATSTMPYTGYQGLIL